MPKTKVTIETYMQAVLKSKPGTVTKLELKNGTPTYEFEVKGLEK
jgi:uncharacterized membrane protein YkoI